MRYYPSKYFLIKSTLDSRVRQLNAPIHLPPNKINDLIREKVDLKTNWLMTQYRVLDDPKLQLNFAQNFRLPDLHPSRSRIIGIRHGTCRSGILPLCQRLRQEAATTRLPTGSGNLNFVNSKLICDI